jgi:hypothetical protein
VEVARQRLDHVEELQERAGPAVGEDQRERVRFRGPDVDEVDGLAVDLGGEVRKLVELRLVRAPVVAGAPVLGKLLQPRQRKAVVPPGAGDLVGLTGAGEPVGQVVQVGLRDVDAKRLDHDVNPKDMYVGGTNVGIPNSITIVGRANDARSLRRGTVSRGGCGAAAVEGAVL